MFNNINGESVYVCYERNDNPKDPQEWVVMGVVSTEKDAEMWTNENPDMRKHQGPYTIGKVEPFVS